MSELGKAKKALEKIEKRQEADYKKEGIARLGQEVLDEWLARWEPEIEPIRTEYQRQRSIHWRTKARKKLVELPPRSVLTPNGLLTDSDYWVWNRRTGQWDLSDKGVAYVRTATREETLASLDVWFKIGLIVVPSASVLASAVLSIFW